MSDGPKQYNTQETTGIYAKHASGITYQGKKRYVLTTRTDGAICWETNRFGIANLKQ